MIEEIQNWDLMGSVYRDESNALRKEHSVLEKEHNKLIKALQNINFILRNIETEYTDLTKKESASIQYIQEKINGKTKH